MTNAIANRLIVMFALMAFGAFCMWLGVVAGANATEARFAPILMTAGFLPGAAFSFAGVLIGTSR